MDRIIKGYWMQCIGDTAATNLQIVPILWLHPLAISIRTGLGCTFRHLGEWEKPCTSKLASTAAYEVFDHAFEAYQLFRPHLPQMQAGMETAAQITREAASRGLMPDLEVEGLLEAAGLGAGE